MFDLLSPGVGVRCIVGDRSAYRRATGREGRRALRGVEDAAGRVIESLRALLDARDEVRKKTGIAWDAFSSLGPAK